MDLKKMPCKYLPKILTLAVFLAYNHLVFGNKLGLYKKSDPMTLFTNDTILPILESNADRVFIVEFYSSWCGHCQMFAPKWLRLSWELKGKVSISPYGSFWG